MLSRIPNSLRGVLPHVSIGVSALVFALVLAGCTTVAGPNGSTAKAGGGTTNTTASSGTAAGNGSAKTPASNSSTSGVATTGTANSSETTVSTASSSAVLRATLDNGLKVVIVRDALAPVVTQQITYLVGSNQSPKGFPGTAHAQEHMMFRGSPGMTGDQLSEISAELGGAMDAFTAENMTSYYFTVPADDLPLTLKIGALRMTGVNDSAADWAKERGAIEQEVARDNSDPLYVLQAKAQKYIFAGTPYENTGLGTKPTFDKTTAAMLSKFYDTYYAPNNALLVVTGDVNPQSTLAQIKKLYGSIPSKTVPKKQAIKLAPVTPQSFTSNTDQPYGMVAYIFRMPGYNSPDYPTAELLAGVLNSRRGPISALTYAGKTLGSGFDYNTLVDTGFGYAWAAFPPGGDAKQIASELKDAVTQAIAKIPPDLVAAQKRQAVLSNALSGNSIAGLAQAWTNAIALEGITSPQQDFDRLQNVDASAVTAAGKSYLDFAHAVTLELTPTPGARPQQGGQIFGTPESFSSTPSASIQLPEWAQSTLAALPAPQPLFKPSVTQLANGIKLIVQPIAGSKSVSVFGEVHTSEALQAPGGKEGVGSLLSDLFEWGPLGMTRSDFEAQMDSIGADYSVGTGFSLQVLPAYLDQGLKLLSEDLLKPALPSQAFKSQQAIFVQQLSGQQQSPVFQYDRAIQTSLLPQGDPALRIATPSSVQSLTLNDIRSYYGKVMRPDETTIVMIGAVQPAAAKAVMEKYFGGWKATGPKPDLVLKPVTASKPTQVLIPDSFRQQDEVVLAETLDSNFNKPDHFAIELGNSFLGGDLFASPLYREMRVKRGLVYFVGSSASFTRTRASFRISYGAYPDNVNKAKQIALQQLQQMADRPLTAKELHLAKAAALHQIELTNQSIGDVAGNWLAYSEQDLSLDRLYIVASHFETLTAADVQAAFKKYVDPSRLSTFILGKPVGK